MCKMERKECKGQGVFEKSKEQSDGEEEVFLDGRWRSSDDSDTVGAKQWSQLMTGDFGGLMASFQWCWRRKKKTSSLECDVAL